MEENYEVMNNTEMNQVETEDYTVDIPETDTGSAERSDRFETKKALIGGIVGTVGGLVAAAVFEPVCDVLKENVAAGIQKFREKRAEKKEARLAKKAEKKAKKEEKEN